MAESNKSNRRVKNNVRQRQAQRYARRDAMVSLKENLQEGSTRFNDLAETARPLAQSQFIQRVKLAVLDLLWYIWYRTPFAKLMAAVLALTVIFTLGTFVLSPNIAPNIWSLDTALTGLTVPQAAAELQRVWQDETRIRIRLEGGTFAEVAPETIGLLLDAPQMAEMARSAGLSGIPFGVNIEPIVTVDMNAAQNYLLSIVDQVYIPPYEAGFAYQGEQLVAVAGSASRELDIAATLERLRQNSNYVVIGRELNLLTVSTPPAVTDATPYLTAAQTFLTSNFRIIGYDPFKNEFLQWATTKEEMVKWLAAGTNSLVIRAKTLDPFIGAINERLKNGETARYLEEREMVETIQSVLASGGTEATVRIRYMPLQYEIAGGDTGSAIARKTGMPFGLIDTANPGLNWNALSIGQLINLPTPDLLLPETPVPDKRIVVDLDRLWLVAYENGQMIYNYPISIGRTSAPTYPGIYQILTHSEKAFGSSFALCREGTTDCGQWEMHYFMGIYEVVPGLMNGFHGDVVLPNGALLGGGGGARSATTYGCVMADNNFALELYAWAETGTMVEIISSDFAPRSDLAKQAYEYIRQQKL